MNNRDKYFKGQQTNEILICFFRKHWINLAKEFLYFFIFMFIIFFVFKYIDTIQEVMRGNRELKLFFLTGFLIATFFIHRFFVKMLNYFVYIGLITNLRVIDHQKSLFFKDSIDAVDMGQIQNIERVREGVFPNVFGYGDIKIFLNASSGIKTFETVPNVRFHFRCLSRQKESRRLADLQSGQLNRSHQNLSNKTNTTVNIPIKSNPSQVYEAEKTIPIES